MLRHTGAPRMGARLLRPDVDQGWTGWGPPGMGKGRMSGHSTHGPDRHALAGHLSTNGCAYPHIQGPYPQARGPKPAIFSGFGGSVRVEHLPQGADVAAEVVVLGHLPLDLLAAVKHG